MKMRNILMSFALFVFLLPTTQAEDTSTPLKENMKQIKVLFQNLNALASDQTQNSQSAEKAKELISLLTAAKSLIPSSIAHLELKDQQAPFAAYQALIQEEIEAVYRLEKAFLHNNNDLAIKIIQEISKIKKKGHQQFEHKRNI